PAIALLALLGAARTFALQGRCPVARLLALTLATTALPLVVFHLLYAWQDSRFLEPLLPLLAALAGGGAALATRVLARALPRTAAAAAAALLVTGALAWHAWPLRAAIATARAAPPAMVARLPGIDADLPRPARVVVNFPLT